MGFVLSSPFHEEGYVSGERACQLHQCHDELILWHGDKRILTLISVGIPWVSGNEVCGDLLAEEAPAEEVYAAMKHYAARQSRAEPFKLFWQFPPVESLSCRSNLCRLHLPSWRLGTQRECNSPIVV